MSNKPLCRFATSPLKGVELNQLLNSHCEDPPIGGDEAILCK